jgi:acylphosphatase
MSPAESDRHVAQERRFVVHGRVQGVGFRWWTRVQAARLGISGDVRNRSDGTVEVRARGRAEDLATLSSLLRQGAPGAQVTKVDESEAGGIAPEGFEILH